jgi:hypothetical protein
MGRAYSMHGEEEEEKKNAHRIFIGKPEGKRPLGRHRRMRDDNIKIILRQIGWSNMDWIDPAQDRDRWRTLVNTVINFGFIKF